MKKIYALAMFGLVFMSTFAIMSVTNKIQIVQAGPTEKIYTNNVTKTIYITSGASTSIKLLKYSVFNNDAWTSRMIINQGSAGTNNTFLLNYSIMVNHSGVLRIDSAADGINWLRLNSSITKDDLSHKTANITCNGGKLFINGTLVTAYNLTAKANDTTVTFEGVAGARPRPHITCNGSAVAGVMKIMNSTIAYLGLENQTRGGVCYDDLGGDPIGHVYGSTIKYCYNGLTLKSTRNVEVDKTNIISNNGYGAYVDITTTGNFTNCKSYGNGADVLGISDYYIKAGSRVIINNSDNLDWIIEGKSNSVTNLFRKVSTTTTDRAFSLYTRRFDLDTSDADLITFNFSTTAANDKFTMTSTDADFANFAMPGFNAGEDYKVLVNDGLYVVSVANASGYVNCNYTGGFSTKTFAIIPDSGSSGSGSASPTYVTCYKCFGNVLRSRQCIGQCDEGWSTTKPDCTASTITVTPPSQQVNEPSSNDPLQSIPGFEAFTLVAALGVCFLILRRKKA
jgi:hypothetical protein